MSGYLKTIITLRQVPIRFLALFLLPFLLCGQARGAVSPDKPAAKPAKQVLAPDPLRQRIDALEKDLASAKPGDVSKKAFELTSLLRKFLMQIHNDPVALARTYYQLGDAYFKAGYMPEAVTYLRLAAKQSPNSQWAQKAVLTLLRNTELSGMMGGDDFYKELIRQFPDTLVGKTAWISLAMKAVAAGNIKEVSMEMERLEAASPDISLSVPKFLDLKARLLAAKGDEKGARRVWMHYINLTQSPDQIADTLFEIAESYRRDKKMPDAAKYYSLLINNHPGSLDALFAKYRLLQIEKEAGPMFMLFSLGPKQAFKKTSSRQELLPEIIRKAPNLPIAKEAILDSMSFKLGQGDYLGVLRLIGQSTKLGGIDDAFVQSVSAIAGKALDGLFAGGVKPGVGRLNEALSIGRRFIAENTRKVLLWPCMSGITQKIWIRLIEVYIARGDFPQAVDEAKGFCGIFPDGDEADHAKALGRAAVVSYDKVLINGNRPIDLLNYHFARLNGISWLSSPEHLFDMGLAWRSVDCPQAAMRSFYKAWEQGPQDGLQVLLTWGDTAADSGDVRSVGAILGIIKDKYPKGVEQNPRVLLLMARLLQSEQGWAGMKQTAQKALALDIPNAMRLDFQTMLLNACVHTGDWSGASSAWKNLQTSLTDKQKEALLKEWGDTALDRKDYVQARGAYSLLSAIDPNDPSCSWRLAIAEFHSGMTAEAAKGLEAVSKQSDPFWAEAAKAVLDADSILAGPTAGLLAGRAETASVSGDKKAVK